MSLTHHEHAQILKNGNSTPSEWFDWKNNFLVLDDDVKEGIAELVAGKKMSSGHPMSNSYPTLKKRFLEQSRAVEGLKNEILAPLADQDEATKLVSKLIEDMDFLSKVMVPQQSDEVFRKLKEMLAFHKTRLISYSALCQQRSIVEQYEEETRAKLVMKLEKEIDTLGEQEVYFRNQLNSAPTDAAKKNAMTELRKTEIQLEAKRTELIEIKGVNTVFDPSDANDFATQQYGDDDEEEEETEQQKLLNLKQKLRDEYESRGSRKRKASSSAPDGASSTPPKKAKSWLGFLWGESEEQHA